MTVAVMACTRRSPPPPAPAPAVQAAAPPDAGAPEATRHETLPALVLSFSGAAEVQRAGAQEWVALKVGDAVRQGDQVRTAQGGALELAIDVARVRVREGTQLRFDILSAHVVRGELAGQVEAETPEGARTLELASAAGPTLARLSGGKLLMTADAQGETSVAALSGGAQLEAAGQRLELQEGEASGFAHQALRPKVRLPAQVTLRVRWPARGETNRAVLALAGRASAYSQVTVQERPVEAAPDGTFHAQVRLRRGRQRVAVVARDPLGRSATETRVITLDPDAPSIQGEVEYR